MSYTVHSMMSDAEKHLRFAESLMTRGTDMDIDDQAKMAQTALAEAQMGLLAVELAKYASDVQGNESMTISSELWKELHAAHVAYETEADPDYNGDHPGDAESATLSHVVCELLKAVGRDGGCHS